MSTRDLTTLALALPDQSRAARRGFSLVELLVVLFIIIIVMAIGAPAMKSMLRGNAQSQAVNLIRAQLSAARAIAISQHRQAGVVFFEENSVASSSGKKDFAPAANTGQTAMQLIVEDTNLTGSTANGTIFVYYSRERQYLPTGIRVAALNDDPGKQVMTGDNTAGTSRVVVFDANGQMILRNGIHHPNPGSRPAPGSDPYPYAYGDWLPNCVNVGDPDNCGVSSPAVLVFSMNDFKDYVNNNTHTGAQLDIDKANWVQQHSDVLIVNAYTGNLIR